MGFRLPFSKGREKERSAETSNSRTGLAPASTEPSETSHDQLTPQEESTAGYYAATATTRSLEELKKDLEAQYSKERVGLILNRIAAIRAEKEKKDMVGVSGEQ